MLLATALDWCARGLGVALTQQGLEGLAIRFDFSEQGTFRLSTLLGVNTQTSNQSAQLGPRQNATSYVAHGWLFRLALALGARGYVWLCGVRVALGLALVVSGLGPAALLAVLVSLLLFARTRDHFNGGSDAMAAMLQLALSLACLPIATNLLQPLALAFIAAQTTLSYFVAGYSKLRQAEWRNGRALIAFLSLPRYALPGGVRRAFSTSAGRHAAGLLSWSVMAFELGFPGVFLGWAPCRFILCFAVVFHLSIAWLLGLNRFWPVWFATYPALLYFSERVSP